MPIVALTREYGSGGTGIAKRVAEVLGYEYVRDEITREAAEAFGIAEDDLIAIVERKPGFWESLTEAAQVEFATVAAEVLRLAERDNVVIMGRWATLLLRKITHCVRIRVCAPFETRVQRVMARRSLSRERAADLIRKADEGAGARIRQFFGETRDDPLLYDLVINTGRLTSETAVQQILQLARRPECQATESSRTRLQNLSLETRINAILKSTRETMRLDINTVADRGAVKLTGMVFVSSAKDQVEEIVKGVEGVQRVDNQIRVYREW